MAESRPKSTRLTTQVKYRLLKEIAFSTLDTLDLDKILYKLLDTLASIVNYDAAGIFVLIQNMRDSRRMYPGQMIAGIAKRGFASRPRSDDQMLMQGKGIIGHVIKTGESVLVPDVRLDDRYVEGRKQTRSEITVPIMIKGAITGALDLESDRVNFFNQQDLKILRFFAGAAAISLEKAMLHRQILERSKIEKQLKMAKEVQQRLLPRRMPRRRGYDIAGLCVSTFAVGGDYYDYISLGKEKLALVVADVSGDGIPAALIMTSFKALLHAYARSESDPAEVMKSLNRQLEKFLGKQDFITACYGVLDFSRHRFSYVNCGHPPPLLLVRDRSVRELKKGDPSLNTLQKGRYTAREITLEENDQLILYTDGVTEIFNRNNEEFGIERLKETIRKSGHRPPRVMIQEIRKVTCQFSGEEHYLDDFTLLIIKRTQ